ncbi:hypothetical protein [Antarctobacter jejuensis]|uniref:hypothetical protein n=1 Tax=Antarctobacter jejuensis TaxID=1439938 RepID=UPI003FD47C70
MTIRILKTLTALCLSTVLIAAPAAAQSLKAKEGDPAGLGFKAPTGPYTEINCNPSSFDHPFTCKCDTSGGCTLLSILCKHVDGPYYQCDEDHSTSDKARVQRLIKAK